MNFVKIRSRSHIVFTTDKSILHSKIDLSIDTFEYFDDAPEIQDVVQNDQTTVLQQIFSSLDNILKKQQNIEERLDTLEQKYAQVSENSGSPAPPMPQGPTRWTEEEHRAYLKCLETMPKSAAQEMS